MTPLEFELAYRGHMKANGFDPDDTRPNVRERLTKLMREYPGDVD